MSVKKYECCAHCHGRDGRCLAGGFHDQPCEYVGCSAGRRGVKE